MVEKKTTTKATTKVSPNATPKTPPTTPLTAPKAATPASEKPAAKKTTTAKPTKPKKVTPLISAEQRTHYVEVAAYFIAERRGFTPGDHLADWVAAEVQVDQLIKEGKLGG